MNAGSKFDEEKVMLDLLPFDAINEVGWVLTMGARKYSVDNWLHVPDARRRYLAAALRHIFSWAGGDEIDSESGQSHLAHAACCILFLLAFELRGLQQE